MVVIDNWAESLQIVQDGVADILRKWQPGLAPAFAHDAQSPMRPIDVLETQVSDIAGAEAEPCK